MPLPIRSKNTKPDVPGLVRALNRLYQKHDPRTSMKSVADSFILENELYRLRMHFVLVYDENRVEAADLMLAGKFVVDGVTCDLNLCAIYDTLVEQIKTQDVTTTHLKQAVMKNTTGTLRMQVLPLYLVNATLAKSPHLEQHAASGDAVPLLLIYYEKQEEYRSSLYMHAFNMQLPLIKLPTVVTGKFTLQVPVQDLGMKNVVHEYLHQCSISIDDSPTNYAKLFDNFYQMLYVVRSSPSLVIWQEDSFFTEDSFLIGAKYSMVYISDDRYDNQIYEPIRVQNGVPYKKKPTNYYDVPYGNQSNFKDFFVEQFNAS